MLSETPLLLLDNSAMNSVVNQGEFKCTNLSFEEARAILEMHGEDVLQCFSNLALESIIFPVIGIGDRQYIHKQIRNMRPNQDAIVFKLYVAPSETQPVIHVEGVEAKKIQNVYAYCQFLSRIK
ncbi:MAG TPA: hypothetical protein H9684_08080 [Firmicutes bacterium]|nr:hypothetical protein [Bacillota bacterium]